MSRVNHQFDPNKVIIISPNSRNSDITLNSAIENLKKSFTNIGFNTAVIQLEEKYGFDYELAWEASQNFRDLIKTHITKTSIVIFVNTFEFELFKHSDEPDIIIVKSGQIPSMFETNIARAIQRKLTVEIENNRSKLVKFPYLLSNYGIDAVTIKFKKMSEEVLLRFISQLITTLYSTFHLTALKVLDRIESSELTIKERGPQLWEILHDYARHFPDVPLNTDKQKAEAFIKKFIRSIGCKTCTRDFVLLLKEKTPEFSSSDKFYKWTLDIHDSVTRNMVEKKYII